MIVKRIRKIPRKRIKGKRPGKHKMWTRLGPNPRFQEGDYTLEKVYRYRFPRIIRHRFQTKSTVPYHHTAYRKGLRCSYTDVLEAVENILWQVDYESIDDTGDDA